MSAADLCLALALSALLSVVVAAAQYMRAEKAEAEVARLTAERDALAAQVARVEALGEKWLAMDEANADYFSRERLDPTLGVRVATARQEQLQAALTGSEADTSDTQTTDQKDQS